MFSMNKFFENVLHTNIQLFIPQGAFVNSVLYQIKVPKKLNFFLILKVLCINLSNSSGPKLKSIFRKPKRGFVITRHTGDIVRRVVLQNQPCDLYLLSAVKQPSYV